MITAGKRSLVPLVAALEQEPAPVATDGELLRRFLSRQDEAAFESLVRRHGPMVFAVCRRALGCTADAEDAFQATFLVLLRKAPGLTPRTTLGDWLHGVARRITLKARTAAARRRTREGAAARPEGNPEVERNDWLPWLDEEVGRLPAKYRLPLVLCDLEGRTRGEAARALGWPEGTVAGYLSRGRAMLAKRLLRRASALGGAVAGTVAGGDAQAVPVRLLEAALPAALGSAPPVVMALAREVLRSMTTITNMLAVGVLALVAGGLLAAGTLMSGTKEESGVNAPAAPEPGPPPVAKPAPQNWKETKVLALPGWLAGSVAYSPDGKTFFVGGTSGNVRAYDTATMKQLWEHQEATNFAAVAATPDGKSVAVTFKDADRRWGIRLINAATRKLELTLEEGGVPGVVGGPEPIAVGFFPDLRLPGDEVPPLTSRKVIFGTAGEYVVKTWVEPAKASTINSRTVAVGKLPADYYAAPLVVDPNGKRAVVTGPIDKDTGKNVLWAWSAGSGEANKVLEGHKGTVVSAAWSKNGKVIVTGDDAGLVIVWDAATFKEKSRLSLGGRVAAVAVTHDGIGVAAGVVNTALGQNTAGEVYTWLADVPPEKPTPLSSQLTGTPFLGLASLAFSPDGKQLVSCFANFTLLTRTGILIGHVRVFAMEPEQKKPEQKPGFVNDVRFAPDGKRYAVVAGTEVRVHDTATEKLVFALSGEAAGYSADGKKLFVMSAKVLECDPGTGETIKEHPRPKPKWGWHIVSFSPDGKRYAAHFGFNVRVYDTATGFEPQQLDDQHEPGSSALPGTTCKQLVWSPDGKQVAAVGVLVDVGKIGMAGWDVETGKRFYSAAADLTDGPRAVAFSSDSKALAIGYERRVDVWTGGRNPVKNLGDHGVVSALAFAPDGKTLAAGIRLPILHGGEKVPRVIGHKTEVRLLNLTSDADEVPKVFDGFEGVNHMAETKLPVTALAFSPDGKKLLAGTGIGNMTQIPKDAPKSGDVKVFDVPARPEKPDPAPAAAQK